MPPVFCVTLATAALAAYSPAAPRSRSSHLAAPTSCTSATRSAPMRPRCWRPSASGFAAARWAARAGMAVAGIRPRMDGPAAGRRRLAAPRPFARDPRTRQLTALLGATIVAILAAQRVMPDRAFWQGFPAGAARLRSCRRHGVGRATAVRPGVRGDRRRRAHRHQRRRRAMGQPLPAGCGAAAPPVGRTRRHRRHGRGPVAGSPRGGRRRNLPRRRDHEPGGVPGAARSETQLRGAGVRHRVVHAARAGSCSPTRGGSIRSPRRCTAPACSCSCPTRQAAARALAELRAERIDRVTLAWAARATRRFPLERALDGTCFRVTATREVPLRGLRLASARCAPE